jgi:trimeric autotransporter adhesin
VGDSCFIGHIRGRTTNIADAIPVVIDSAGQLGTLSSSQRFKKDIKPMEGTSSSVLDLKPVTFHYKNDKSNIPQFGLIAEEVAKVSPDLVARDKNGEIYTVRYDAVNVMLLNEFVKEHRKVEELEAAVAELAATVKEQAAELRRVSGQVNHSGAELVLSNR